VNVCVCAHAYASACLQIKLFLRANRVLPVYIPGGCTDVLQPVDHHFGTRTHTPELICTCQDLNPNICIGAMLKKIMNLFYQVGECMCAAHACCVLRAACCVLRAACCVFQDELEHNLAA